MEFHDSNGNEFAMVGAMIMGTVKDGQWIKFTNPWKTVPNVIVTPISLQTAIAGFSSTNLYLDCRAQNITTNGFQCVCRTVLKSGSGGAIQINDNDRVVFSQINIFDLKDSVSSTISESPANGYSGWNVNYHDFVRELTGDYSYGEIYSFNVNSTSNYVELDLNFLVAACNLAKGSPTTAKTHIWIKNNGNTVVDEWLPNVDAYNNYTTGDYRRKYSFSVNPSQPIIIYAYQAWERHNERDGDSGCGIKVTLNSINYSVSADTPLASGNAFFLCTDKSPTTSSIGSTGTLYTPPP